MGKPGAFQLIANDCPKYEQALVSPLTLAPFAGKIAYSAGHPFLQTTLSPNSILALRLSSQLIRTPWRSLACACCRGLA